MTDMPTGTPEGLPADWPTDEAAQIERFTRELFPPKATLHDRFHKFWGEHPGFRKFSVLSGAGVLVSSVAVGFGPINEAIVGEDENASASVPANSHESSSSSSSTTSATSPALSSSGDANEAVPVTDRQLQILDKNVYNCGGHLQPETPEGKYSVDYAINYYNQNPELGKQIRQFHIDSLGQSAWDVLLQNGRLNLNTNAQEQFQGSGDEQIDLEVDQLLHQRSRASLGSARVYANYSCVSGGEINVHRATNKPTIAIQEGNHVEGVRVNDQALVDFVSKVNKNADGKPVVDIIDIGMQPIEEVNGQTIQEHQSLVVLYADGCDNPVLRLTPLPERPTTTSTPHRTTSTTRGRGTTTTTGNSGKRTPPVTVAPPPTTSPPETTPTTHGDNDSGPGAPPNPITTPTTEKPPATLPPTSTPPTTRVEY